MLSRQPRIVAHPTIFLLSARLLYIENRRITKRHLIRYQWLHLFVKDHKRRAKVKSRSAARESNSNILDNLRTVSVYLLKIEK